MTGEQTHCQLAEVMFAEVEPLIRERRKLRARMRELADAMDARERQDENRARWDMPESAEHGQLDRRNDELGGNLADLMMAAFGHAILAISEAAR